VSRSNVEDVAAQVLTAARAAGADAADTVVVESDGLEVGVRLGEPEKLRRARERRVGLRVLVGSSTAIVSTADLSRAAIEEVAREACALARVTAPDEHAGLPDPSDLATALPDLELYDPAAAALEPAAGFALATRAERAALDADPTITNSEGAEFSGGSGHVAYGSSAGFLGAYRSSFFSLSVVPVATRDGELQRDSWYPAGRRLGGLDEPEAVGLEAARRTVRRLGARQIPTGTYPVVFDPPTASSLVRHLASAISGPALYRRTSFLVDRLGDLVTSAIVTIVDDPLRVAGPASRPFDGEGIASRTQTIVERGVLQSYLLDTYSGRRLGRPTTGHATRSVGDAPSVAPTNLHLSAGSETPEAIVASVDRGLYVTELIGFGVNLVTGDYSRGAVGLHIEHGELTHAVHEVTIAGNLRDVLTGIDRVGNDLDERRATSAPTLRVQGLTVAGA
jgi:PmbA protein